MLLTSHTQASTGPTPTASFRRRLARGLMFMVALCTSIAVFLTIIDGGFKGKLIYSFSIGMCCWLITDGVRLLLSWAMDHRRERRGLGQPAQPGFDIGWLGMLALVMGAVVLGPPLGLAIADAITGNRSPRIWDLGSRATQITLAISVLATLVAVAVLSAQERAAAMRLRAQAAQREAAETQLRLLQSQLEPHMLFNTLANLRVLIGLDPLRAQAMLDRLIGFLRATLTASRLDSHPLTDEFARVEDYLALMAVRMGPRLQTRLLLPAELAAVPVPPLLLQPLVENCIKHGLEPNIQGGRIEVSAARDGRQLVLSVRDTGVGLEAPASAGTRFGLEQVRARLRTLHGDAATLRLEPAADPEGGTLATIRLPLPQ
jgi:sensor histidine kinase YesM